MSLDKPTQSTIDAMCRVALEDWCRYHDDVPPVLYHYTSADALANILGLMTLHLTDLRYVNDMSELQYAKTILSTTLTNRLASNGLDEIQIDLLTRLKAGFDGPSDLGAFFSMSFCEKGNLLSQWRAYRGKGGGYAIGFDFFHLPDFLSRECVLRKVIYKVTDQTALLDGLIDRFLTLLADECATKELDAVRNDTIPALCQAFRATASEYLFCLKHPDFEEEREWRLVHFGTVCRTHYRDAQVPQFRSYEGNIVPYYSVSFERAIKLSRDDKFGLGFPIVELMIGPTVNADLNAESVRLLLLSLNPDIVPSVKRSEIPLRWL